MKPCMHLEKSIFSLNNVTVRPTKIMNRADKNWAHFYKKKVLQKSKFSKKKPFNKSWSPSPIFFTEFFPGKDLTNFQH
jgi:hypothetical protein